jgi:hypothetical protein
MIEFKYERKGGSFGATNTGTALDHRSPRRTR